jgi:hypothetical protein
VAGTFILAGQPVPASMRGIDLNLHGDRVAAQQPMLMKIESALQIIRRLPFRIFLTKVNSLGL